MVLTKLPDRVNWLISPSDSLATYKFPLGPKANAVGLFTITLKGNGAWVIPS